MTTPQAMSTHLSTERLALQPWSMADASLYQALVAERGGGMPTEADCRERITTQLDSSARTGLTLLTMRRRAEGDLVGYCGLLVGRASVEEPEIAFEIFRHAQNHGYAAEAARAVLDAAMASCRSRIWATVRLWNAPSLRVLDKLGFARDHISVDDNGELVWLTRSLP